MRIALIVLVTLVLSAPAGGQTDAATAPAVRLASRSPLTVAGSGFKARERVVVTVNAGETWTQRGRATAAGAFRLTFTGVVVDRCAALQIRVQGLLGSRAITKLPEPACMTQQQP